MMRRRASHPAARAPTMLAPTMRQHTLSRLTFRAQVIPEHMTAPAAAVTPFIAVARCLGKVSACRAEQVLTGKHVLTVMRWEMLVSGECSHRALPTQPAVARNGQQVGNLDKHDPTSRCHY